MLQISSISSSNSNSKEASKGGGKKRVKVAPPVSVFSNIGIGRVLFLMPPLPLEGQDEEGPAGPLLQVTPSHEKLLTFYQGLVGMSTLWDETIARRDNDTFVFGDEMFLVALQVACADLKGRDLNYDLLSEETSPANFRLCSENIRSVFRHFCFMNTR